MSGVVLRCPHCGTTQATPGECEACHEAEVRWFCPNHSPGRWLDAPRCPECGAGVARERPPPPPPPAPPSRRPSAVPPLGAPSRPIEPRRPRDDPFDRPWGERGEPAEVGYPEEAGVPAGWRRVEVPPPIRLRPVPFLGCVGRLLMYAVTAIILLAMATCWFFGGSVVVGAAPAGDAGRAPVRWASAAAADAFGVRAGPPARFAPR
jgi:hypothetical protein